MRNRLEEHRPILAMVLALLAVTAGAGLAATDAVDVDIKAQRLPESLKSVAEVFDLQIAFLPEDVRDIQAPALTGRFTADEALSRLLQDTELEYRYVDEDSVAIGPKKEGGEEDGRGRGREGPTLTEEITVTATRRDESVQDIPMSVYAMTRETIEQKGIVSFVDYGVEIPNMAFAPSNSSFAPSALSITIRGVAGQGTTGFYIDDTPLPEGLNPRVIDMERIETLRGPQGTLFGARSLGGTVRLITTPPSTEAFSGYAHTTVSTITDGGESVLGDVGLNIPLSDDAALRLTAYGQDIGGFIDIAPSPGPFVAGDPSVPLLTGTIKDVNGNEAKGLQLSGRFELLDDRLTVTPRFMYEDVRYDGRTEVDVTDDSSVESRTNERPFDLPETTDDEWRLGTLTVDYDARFGGFTSASSWFDREARDLEDTSIADAAGALSGITGVPLLPLLQFLNPAFPAFPDFALSPILVEAALESDSFTQEFRFTSSWEGPLQLTAGLFYQEIDTHFEFPPTALPPIPTDALDLFSTTSDSKVEEKAVFGEARYSFTDGVRLIFGGRQFDNDVSLTNFQGGTFGSGLTISETQSEDGFIPRFGVQLDIDQDQMLYATTSEGFRIGGPNTLPLALCEEAIVDAGLDPRDVESFQSDTLRSYELGYKSDLSGGRVRLNTALFHTEWDDIQQRRQFACGFGAVVNLGGAEIRGGEAELDAFLTNGLTLSVGAGYNDAEIVDNSGFDDFLPLGSSIQDVPEWTFNGALNWQFMVSEQPLFGYLSFSHVGDSEGRQQVGVDRAREAYNLVNLRFGAYLAQGKYTLTLFVQNVTDEAADFGNKPPLGLDVPGLKRTTVSFPRTVGVDLRYNF